MPWSRLGVLAFVGASAAAAVAGFWQLNRYNATPGESGAAVDWPDATGLDRATDRSTVVVALHPECGCSAASVEELGAALAEMKRAPRVLLLFADYGLPGRAPDQSPLWAAAASLPGATRVVDADARLAARFGAATSGEIRVFEPAGRLVFAGGVTASRGHPGDSPARRGLVAAVDRPSGLTRMPVFGCSLGTPESERPVSRP
ncbi:MAG TPA: hypothetical protein VEB66_11120 [Opitutaceae bacterium]|nr:hypothetical protein [Opitutaceae bacterium]